jgi:hypothetical protein
MDGARSIVSTAFAWAITFVVPGAVWSLLVAGLYQLIRDSLRRARPASQRTQTLARKSAG